MVARALLLALVAPVVSAGAEKENPLGKVIQLLDDLTAKVVKEGEAEAKAFKEYKDWCDDAAHNARFAIEDATKQKEKLGAQVSEFSSDIDVATGKIEQLAADVASAQKDVEKATTIREKEASDFSASEKELMETVDTLSRAISVLEKEMSKSPAAFAQLDMSSMAPTLAAITAVLDAASFSNNDKQRLQVLLQQQADAEDGDIGAPAAAAYKSHSSGIVDLLEDLKDKAETELSEARKSEVNAKHNYDMLKQSLESQLGQDSKDLEEEKAEKAQAEEGKATAEGELSSTVKSLANSKEELESTQGACITTAADHDTTSAGRDEELKVIAQAKKILQDTSSGAVSQTYSFVQLRTERTSSEAAEVAAAVRKLAKRHHSAALAQLASRVAAVAKFGASNSEDIFAKVKDLIQDMVEKLEKEAEAEAEEKAYCDEQMAKTEEKKGDLEDDIAKATAKIDSAVSKSANLKDEVKVLQQELAALSREQASMDKIRMETHADYEVAKKDLELGLSGVRKALSVLRDYYGGDDVQDDDASFMQQPAAPEKHSKSSGAGQSIIGILEVVESDFAKNLAKEESQEADAESEYQKVTQENKVTQATKQQDEKYKTQESKSLDKAVAELSADREAAGAELSAVDEYYAKIKERCIAKPETFEVRKARREAEIEGLKTALKTLEEETALLQSNSRIARRVQHRRHGAAFLAAN